MVAAAGANHLSSVCSSPRRAGSPPSHAVTEYTWCSGCARIERREGKREPVYETPAGGLPGFQVGDLCCCEMAGVEAVHTALDAGAEQPAVR